MAEWLDLPYATRSNCAGDRQLEAASDNTRTHLFTISRVAG